MGARSAVSGIGGQQFVDQLVDGDQLDRPHVRGAAAVLVASKNQGRASRAVGPGPHGDHGAGRGPGSPPPCRSAPGDPARLCGR